MARLTDPEILARYKQALADWQCTGAIVPKGKLVWQGLRSTLGEVDWKYFAESLYKYVIEEEGEIDQVKEERENWRQHWEFHYDPRPTIDEIKLYVETRLYPESFNSRDDPVIFVVNIKAA